MQKYSRHDFRRLLTFLLLLVVVAGCAGAGHSGGKTRGPQRPELIGTPSTTTDLYRQAGFIAGGAPINFVGSVRFLAGPPDTSLIVISFSLPNRSLTFVREGDGYRASYAVVADIRQGSATIRHIEAHEVVRVLSFKETTRSDESVIFQQILSVPPAQYVLSLSIRDEGSSRSGNHEEILNVPAFTPGKLGGPLSVYEARERSTTDSLPQLTVSPRATATFGRDTTLALYVEAYGPASRVPLHLTARSPQGSVLWVDSLNLPRRGQIFSGIVNVPTARLGVGIATLTVDRRDTRDSARISLLITFGDDLAISSYEEMLSYLRYFTTPERLQALRDTAPDARGAAWTAFLRETDPVLSTPEHEGLREYFQRIQQANERFRDEGGAGWTSDRGMVYVTLGEPDQILDQTSGSDVSQRGRAQVWEYRQYHTQLVFIDQTGFGRWRITSSSEADFQSIVQRLRTK